MIKKIKEFGRSASVIQKLILVVILMDGQRSPNLSRLDMVNGEIITQSTKLVGEVDGGIGDQP